MSRIALLLGASLLGGSSDGDPPAERVRAFCEGIRVGEPFAGVRTRYGAFRLQPAASRRIRRRAWAGAFQPTL